ncbi:MAG: ACP S-malonyltransferase [Clostridia bacterium]
MKTAFLFPGQGAQTVGMGKDIYEKYPEAKQVFDKAEEISGIKVKDITFNGPEEILKKTENTQIAILTTSLAMLKVLENKGIKADIAVGLSLGEYAALIYGGYISFEDDIKLIQKRGYYMGNFLPEEEFSMAAVIGLDSSTIEKVCSQIRAEGKFVVPANYNCSVQTAISGNSEAIDIAIERLKQAGAKRVVKLQTSGPFHTEKLEQASSLFGKELEKVEFKSGNGVKVIKNIDGQFYTAQDNFKQILANHIISPVRFDKAIELMRQEGVTEFIEIGPGKTLTSFVKKDYPEAEVYNVNNLDSLQTLISREDIEK